MSAADTSTPALLVCSQNLFCAPSYPPRKIRGISRLCRHTPILHLVLTKWNSVQKSHLAAGVAPMRCRCSTSQGERTVSPRVSIYNRNMHDVVVYSRQGCHLCDVVKETLRKLQDKADYRWREVDIDADRELQQKYNDEVPVVLINGRKAFKYHMSARDFLRVLAERE